MARKNQEEFDWLNDPFDEKKAAREEARMGTSNGTKLALGCGCLLAVVGVVVLIGFTLIGMIDIMMS